MSVFILLFFISPVAFTTPFGPCGCKWDQIWNDVVYLIDTSEISGERGLQQIWGTMQSMSAWFNIQKTGYTKSNYTMRLGLIAYNSNASVVAPLGSLDNDDVENLNQFPYTGGAIANIESGIYAAINEFSGPSHRPDSRPVIVLLAFGDNDNDDASNVAEVFKQSGGGIIVWQFKEGKGTEPSQVLQKIASMGYFLTTSANSEQDVQNALCDANCFCPENFVSYYDSNRYVPQEGCYAAMKGKASYNIASNTCKQINNGAVAFTQTSFKARFVSAMFGNQGQFYIGATYDNIDHAWEWADGTPVGNSSNWLNGQTPSGSNGQTCVYLSATTLQWVATDCRNSYMYACEIPPCGSMYYCPYL